MSDIKSAYRAGRDAVSGASKRTRLKLLLLPGIAVAGVNLVLAYRARSISDAVIAGVVWLVVYPVLVILFNRPPKS